VSRFQELENVVSPAVLDDALTIGDLLTELGVPHALIGGLAVGMNGFPRATKDVDYLVGSEAFEMTTPFLVYRDELKDKIKMGVVDLLAVPERYPFLAEQLRTCQPGELHVISPEALVFMKLVANRPQDRADVSRLLQVGVSAHAVAVFVGEHAPELLSRFAEIVEQTPGA